jgi:metal-responsive CopG/Arc/MetJ family transcriptional regulator
MGLSTVNISFPKSLLRSIDEVAREEIRSRSELLREAMRLYIERKRRLNRTFAFWRGEAKASGLKPSDVGKAIARVRALKKNR